MIPWQYHSLGRKGFAGSPLRAITRRFSSPLGAGGVFAEVTIPVPVDDVLILTGRQLEPAAAGVQQTVGCALLIHDNTPIALPRERVLLVDRRSDTMHLNTAGARTFEFDFPGVIVMGGQSVVAIGVFDGAHVDNRIHFTMTGFIVPRGNFGF